MNKKTYLNFLILASMAIILALIPVIVRRDYILSIFINIFLFAYLSQSWNLLGGYTGYLSLGHTVFFGIGAYTSSLLFFHFGLTPWIGMLIGAVLAGLMGLFVGFLSFRYQLRGIFFAMITLAFGVIYRVIFTNSMFLGGAQGILIPLQKPSFWIYQFEGKFGYYYIGLAMLVVILIITIFLEHSKFGYNLLALKGNENAAEALGINTRRSKLGATVLSTFLTAFAGTYYAQYLSYISPETVFNLNLSIEIVLVSIVGGMGTIFGPTLGAFLLTPFSELTRSLLGDKAMGLHVVLYGIILIIFCLVLPNGIIPSIRLSKRSRSMKDA
jgi:branched-chain amino acid transport system permease protein